MRKTILYEIREKDFLYYDLRQKIKSECIEHFFPEWRGNKETLGVFVPHDDDAILGPGYGILAAVANGAQVHVFLYCKGDAGYSTKEAKDDIIEVRKAETLNAYKRLGISDLIRFDLPDFSVTAKQMRFLPSGEEGIFHDTVRFLRRYNITRVLLPNEYMEHIDHEAVGRIARLDGPQAGDNILVDLGDPITHPKTYAAYNVWADFDPSDALMHSDTVRANFAIVATPKVEDLVGDAIREFASQGKVIEDIMAERSDPERGRRIEIDGKTYYIEPYLRFDPRPKIDLVPIKERVLSIKANL